MERGQGRRFSEARIAVIRNLLAKTDMTVTEIALRMDCTRGAVSAINRRFGIRQYGRSRTEWELRTGGTGTEWNASQFG